MKRKVLFLLAALLLPAAASAYDACINGIYYNIVKKARQATVTYGESESGTYSGNVNIPATVEYDGVTCNVIAIGDYAFNHCEELTSVVIPNDVTSIGSYAFSGCHKLSSIILPTKLEEIGASAFSYTALKSLSIPPGLISIGRYAFDSVNLESLYITDLAAWCNIKFGNNPIRLVQRLYVDGKLVTDLVIPNGVKKISNSAFAYAKMLKSVTIPATVTEIGEYAFSNTTIERANIPDSVETISEAMFYDCSNLKSITIGKGVKTIEYRAFGNCENLENVYISDLAAWCRVESTFSWNNGLGMSGTDYNSPLKYAKHLYLNGREIKDLVLPEKIFDETISWNNYNYTLCEVFSYFEGLTSIVIPKEVVSESILGKTYISILGCGNLKSLKNSAALESIYVSGCNNLTYLDFGTGANKAVASGENLVSIDSDAKSFRVNGHCDKLTTIYLGKNTEKVDVGGCKELTDVYCAASAVPKAYFSEDCQVNYATLHVLGEFIEQYRAADGWKDFGTIVALQPGDPGYFKPDMTPINFADATVKSICVANWDFNKDGQISVFEASQVKDLGSAFYKKDITTFNELKYFTSLKSVSFSNCTSLTSVVIPDGVTTLYFNGCSSLTSIVIPDGVTTLDFNGCSSLTSIVIPDGVTTLDFNGCSSLNSINIPSSVTTIETDGFKKCTSLTAVHITDMAAWLKIQFYSLDSNPLGYAPHLYLNGKEVTNLVIPAGVTSIKSFVFYGCSGLTSVTIPSSVNSIGNLAFGKCENLSSVYISDLEAWCNIKFGYNKTSSSYYSNVPSLAFFNSPHSLYLNGKEIKHLVIPNSVTSIGAGVFENCDGLTSVTLPNTVTSIGEGAFASCDGLTSITIPKSVQSLGKWAFSNCRELAVVRSLIEVPFSISPDVFHYSSYNKVFTDATLYVPRGTKAKYETTEGWKEFKTIIETDFNEQPKGDLNLDSQVNGTDVVALVNVIMQGGNNSAADVNGDGKVNGTDIVALVNIVMQTSLSREMAVAGSRGGKEAEDCNATAAIGAALTPTGTDGSQELAISLTNPAMDVTMVQMDVTLPEGVTLDDDAATMSGRTTGRSHQLYTSHLDERTVRLLLVSGHNALIAGTEGDIVRLPLTVGDGFRGGDIVVDHALCTSPDQTEAWPQAVVLHLAEDGTMGIGSVGMAAGESVSVHSLTGQRLAAPRKGVNIVNGKKIIVK